LSAATLEGGEPPALSEEALARLASGDATSEMLMGAGGGRELLAALSRELLNARAQLRTHQQQTTTRGGVVVVPSTDDMNVDMNVDMNGDMSDDMTGGGVTGGDRSDTGVNGEESDVQPQPPLSAAAAAQVEMDRVGTDGDRDSSEPPPAYEAAVT
jgi:hypothetical protein